MKVELYNEPVRIHLHTLEEQVSWVSITLSSRAWCRVKADNAFALRLFAQQHHVRSTRLNRAYKNTTPFVPFMIHL
jgi:hypothetical protein